MLLSLHAHGGPGTGIVARSQEHIEATRARVVTASRTVAAHVALICVEQVVADSAD